MLIQRLFRAGTISTRARSQFFPPLAYKRISIAKMSTSNAPKLEHVAIDTEDGIAVIKYNRPKNGNALHTLMLKDILAGLQWADQDDNVRVIITTGEGKLYTAGLDLLDPINRDETSTISKEFTDVLSDIHILLIKSNKVFVAAVNGPAPGWGTSSLALHDLVYSTPDAFFFTPFVQWGLCAEACSSYTFKSIMGRQKASALILGGARMTAEEMERAGMVTKILKKEGFLDGVLGIARGMVKLPKESLKVNKELIMRGTREDLLRINEVEKEILMKQASSKESHDAINGFKEAQERKKKEKAKL